MQGLSHLNVDFIKNNIELKALNPAHAETTLNHIKLY